MKIKNTRGLTLIELLISMSILSIIGLAFFSTINTGIKFNKKNETDIKALHLAQSEVENLRVQIKKSVGSNLNIEDLQNNKIFIDSESTYVIDGYEVRIEVKQKENLLYKISVKVEGQKFTNKKTEIITEVVKGKGM